MAEQAVGEGRMVLRYGGDDRLLDLGAWLLNRSDWGAESIGSAPWGCIGI